MTINTLNEWLNESNQLFLESTKENLERYELDPDKVTINSDRSIDYDGDVYLSDENLKCIPFKFNKVEGDFNCSRNMLKSLIGSPNTVKGDFDCSENSLISLKCGPISVGKIYMCAYNMLISLKGTPKKWEYGSVGLDYNLILYNPSKIKLELESYLCLDQFWDIRVSDTMWENYSGKEYLKMAFERLNELDEDEILGIEEGLEKAEMPNDLRRYCQKEIFKWKIAHQSNTKVRKIFKDDLDDEIVDMF